MEMEDDIDIEEDDLFLEDYDEDLSDDSDDGIDNQLKVDVDVTSGGYNYINFREWNIQSLERFEQTAVVSLTREEKDFIKSCKDTKLVRLLILNRSHASQWRELQLQLQHLLSLCNKSIARGKENIAEFKTISHAIPRNIIKSDVWKTAAPYFKNAQFFAAPPNEDVNIKTQNGELCLLDVSEGRRWTLLDKRTLLKSVKLQYFDYCHNELKKTIAIKKYQAKRKEGSEKVEALLEIDRLNEERTQLKYDYPPLDMSDKIDWFTISTVSLRGRHPIIACIAFWNLVLHPQLNIDKWTAEEEKKLLEIAKENQFQDWNKIAQELGTNRSAYVAVKHYLSKLCSKYCKDRFTPEEDKYLSEVVINVRLGSYIPWGKVASYFDNRSKYQLYHRYKYYLSYTNVKRGIFTPAEDALLISLVNKFGKTFNKVAEFFPNRTPIQLRNRYGCYWDKDKSDIQVGHYSYDDDLAILDYGEKKGDNNWSILASSLNRTRAHVRQRYLALKKWMENNPTLKLKDMPTRSRNGIMKNHCSRYESVAEILKKIDNSNTLPTLEDLEDKPKPFRKHPLPLRTYPARKRKAVSGSKCDANHGSSVDVRDTSEVQNDKVEESATRIVTIIKMLDENGELCRYVDDIECAPEDPLAPTLKRVKNILKNESTMAIKHDPSDSCDSDDRDSKLDVCLIPPNGNTLICLRALLIKFDMFKDDIQNHECFKNLPSKCEQPFSDELIPKIECSEANFIKTVISNFWCPLLMSRNQPTTHLDLPAVPDSSTLYHTPKSTSVIEKRMYIKTVQDQQEMCKPTIEESQSTQFTMKIRPTDMKTPLTKINKKSKKQMYRAKVILMNKARLSQKTNSDNRQIPSYSLTEVTNPTTNAFAQAAHKVINATDIFKPPTGVTVVDKQTLTDLMANKKIRSKIIVINSVPKTNTNKPPSSTENRSISSIAETSTNQLVLSPNESKVEIKTENDDSEQDSYIDWENTSIWDTDAKMEVSGENGDSGTSQ